MKANNIAIFLLIIALVLGGLYFFLSKKDRVFLTTRETMNTISGENVHNNSHSLNQMSEEAFHKQEIMIETGKTLYIETNGPASREMTKEEIQAFEKKFQ